MSDLNCFFHCVIAQFGLFTDHDDTQSVLFSYCFSYLELKPKGETDGYTLSALQQGTQPPTA